jgi:hypothetical protein
MSRLYKGQRVRVRHLDRGGDWCEGVVVVASDTNLSSVGLMLNGAVRAGRGGLSGGALLVTLDYEAGTVVGLTGDEIEVAG